MMIQRLFPLLGIGASILLYILTLATTNTSWLAQYYWWVIAVAAVLIIILLITVGHYAWLLSRANRRQVIGSQLARRLAAMFTLVTVLPGVFLFFVSAQFISQSINSWFGDDTDQALERSLNLSKSALNLAVDNSFGRALNVQAELFRSLSQGAAPEPTLQASRLTEQFDQTALFDLTDNKPFITRNPANLPPPVLEQETAGQILHSGSARSVENVNNVLYAQIWLVLPEYRRHQYALFFRRRIPNDVAQDATLIEAARSKYAELSYAKKGLRNFFLITLLSATFLSIMLALAIALFFAFRFIEPIVSLAEGARAVAQGDFSQKRPVYRNDELGRLTHLFNHMTEQLGIAQSNAERNRQQTEAARQYLATILENLSAGIMTFDTNGILKTYNPSAEKILGTSFADIVNSNWQQWPQHSPQHAILSETIATLLGTVGSDKPVQIPYSGPDEARILLGKATPLGKDQQQDIIVMFDDVTALVRAQKEAAWGEVAKRLAHEIRNPLTPIQLSAERLAWKLADKLNEQDAGILNRSTATIIKQVEVMKDMVEAFRNYARSPALKLERMELNQIIEDVLLLYEGSSCTFSANLSNIPIHIAADQGAMRQVLHNIFKNAAEAAEESPHPQVEVNTRLEGNQALLTVSNNGKSFSQEMLHHAFEPYMTDKPTGTGLGLPVVKKIIEEHGGRISLSNLADGGACVKISLPELVEEQAHEK